MDMLNTFFVFNFSATIAALAALFLMRESVAATVAQVTARAKVSGFNLAGATGAATSMVLLASVAVLFR